MIASEMSPLKQPAWQDRRAFSWRRVRRARLFITRPFIADRPTDTRHVHYGAAGFQAREGCHSRVSFAVAWFVFQKDRRMNWVIFLLAFGCLARVFRPFVKDDILSAFYPSWEDGASIQIP